MSTRGTGGRVDLSETHHRFIRAYLTGKSAADSYLELHPEVDAARAALLGKQMFDTIMGRFLKMEPRKGKHWRDRLSREERAFLLKVFKEESAQ